MIDTERAPGREGEPVQRPALVYDGDCGIKTSVQTFGLTEANEALAALKNDAIKGAGVLLIS